MKLNPQMMMRREFDGTALVLDSESNEAMSLNKVGAIIWESLEKGLSEEQVAEAVTAQFAVDSAVAARDVSSFLEILKSKGMLVD